MKIYDGLKFYARGDTTGLLYNITNIDTVTGKINVSWCKDGITSINNMYTIEQAEKYLDTGTWELCAKEERKNKLKRLNNK